MNRTARIWMADAPTGGRARRRLMRTGRLLVLLSSTLTLPACAQAADCLSDAEVEAAVREQLQSGAFAVRTDMLRDRPLCSGLTMAQTIQNISARHAAAKAAPDAMSAAPRPASAALPDITRALRFEDPRLCGSVALGTFFEAADKAGSNVLGPLGRIPVSRSRPSTEGAVTRRAEFRASWNGLTLTALEYVTAPDSEYTEVRLYRMIFAEPATMTGPVIGRLGFGVNRAGQTNEIYDQDTMMDPSYVSLKNHEEGSVLECY